VNEKAPFSIAEENVVGTNDGGSFENLNWLPDGPTGVKIEGLRVIRHVDVTPTLRK
jgi:hypothetical protein